LTSSSTAENIDVALGEVTLREEIRGGKADKRIGGGGGARFGGGGGTIVGNAGVVKPNSSVVFSFRSCAPAVVAVAIGEAIQISGKGVLKFLKLALLLLLDIRGGVEPSPPGPRISTFLVDRLLFSPKSTLSNE
jgi:hypothetical protein